MTPLDQRSAFRRGLYLYNTQHSQETYIYANVGIRTRNSNKWTATDSSLRLHCYRDWLIYKAFIQNNIPSTLWLTAILLSRSTLQHITVTSIRERGYHVPSVNVWSCIVCDNTDPPPTPFWYVTGSETSEIWFPGNCSLMAAWSCISTHEVEIAV